MALPCGIRGSRRSRVVTLKLLLWSVMRASSSVLARNCGTAMRRGVGDAGGGGVGLGGAGDGVARAVGVAVAVGDGVAVDVAGTGVPLGTATGFGTAVGAGVGMGVATPSRPSVANPKKPAPSATSTA